MPAESPALRFEDFYRERLDRTVRQVALMVGSVAAAQDVTHDVMIEIYKRWPDIDDPPSYLYRAAANRAISFIRRRTSPVPSESRPVGADEPGMAFVEMVELLDRLNERQRVAVVLRYYEGLTETEIAAVLGCRPGTVGPLLTRARATLRKELQDE